ncbi:MAG: hypothetical protein SX243_22535 [Acidobacteriota bacterium]|nr:hypothetical protein [Acidobacteriota bacterium]
MIYAAFGGVRWAGCAWVAAALLTMVGALPSAAAEGRLGLELAALSLERGVETPVEIVLLGPGGEPTEASQDVEVSLAGWEALMETRAVIVPAGRSMVSLRVRPREFGLWRIEARAEGWVPAFEIVSCPRPPIVEAEPPRESGSENEPLSEGQEIAPPPLAGELPETVDLEVPAELSDARVQEHLQWLVSGSVPEDAELSAAERDFQRQLRQSIQSADGAPLRLVFGDAESEPSVEPRFWVDNRVQLENQTGPVFVQQQTRSEDTEPITSEKGSLLLMVDREEAWPWAGEYPPVEILAFWTLDGTPQRRSLPLSLKLVAQAPNRPTLAPTKLNIERGSDRSEPATLSTTKPGTVRVEGLWGVDRSDPAEIHFRAPVPEGLRFSSRGQQKIYGVAKVKMPVVLELISDQEELTQALEPVSVFLEVTGPSGSLLPGEIKIEAGRPLADTVLELSQHGTYELTAQAVGLGSAHLTVVYGIAWWPLIAAVLGGLFGAFFRLSQLTRGQRKGRFVRVVAGGLFGGLLMFLLQAFELHSLLEARFAWAEALSGVPILNLLGAFLLGVIGGLAFDAVVGRFTKSGSPTER